MRARWAQPVRQKNHIVIDTTGSEVVSLSILCPDLLTLSIVSGTSEVARMDGKKTDFTTDPPMGKTLFVTHSISRKRVYQ
ncbi:hypothetical protein EON65_17640 [archaeon]|nr:MAG: hypothetical protein EON65_17640 [archaeon]